MTNFKCSNCGNVYSANYPTDDHCIICNTGRIRLTDEPLTALPFHIVIDGKVVNLDVQKSNAGYYLGYFSHMEVLIDRVSVYYASKEEAQKVLDGIMKNTAIYAVYGVAGDEYKR